MPKPAKNFDCLKMKRELQEKLRRRWHGLSSEEIVAAIREDLAASDDPLVVRWRAIPTAAERSAERPDQRPTAAKRKMRKPAR